MKRLINLYFEGTQCLLALLYGNNLPLLIKHQINSKINFFVWKIDYLHV